MDTFNSFIDIDLKSRAEISLAALNKEELCFLNRAFKITCTDEMTLREKIVDKLSYHQPCNSSLDDIKNWIRYKICTKRKLYANCTDCDVLEEVMVLQSQILQKIATVTDVRFGKKILRDDLSGVDQKDRLIVVETERDGIILLETDTMNSFATTFNEFMRIWLSKIYKSRWWYRVSYMKEYGVEKADDIYRDIFFLENIENWYAKASSDIQTILEEFATFAKYTHCLANMIVVPYGYNAMRNCVANDYFDLSLVYLQRNMKSIQHPFLKEKKSKVIVSSYTWYINHLVKIIRCQGWFANFELREFEKWNIQMLFPSHSLTAKVPKDNNTILWCIKSINERIRQRGENLLDEFGNSTK